MNGSISRAVLKYHSPIDKSKDQYYFGKGITTCQHIASACIEFFERYCAKMKSGDRVLTASFDEVAARAINPVHFTLPSGTDYHPGKKIEWIWGYSLSRGKPVLVPANLVFYPYEAASFDKHIVRSDTNGLASGNNKEEAILHGLLELIERDQVTISEYNRLPVKRILPDTLPAACLPLLDTLNKKGYEVYIYSGSTDLPLSFITVFLRLRKNHSICSVSSGTHLDPVIALERALTEAVQLLPRLSILKDGSIQGRRNFILPVRRIRFVLIL
ncbi:MAG: YcaO-like family protein [Chitinophagaceae bacterium]|nr:YcaO-like family protein [Chitinophagaceae bacterium]